MDRVDAAFQRSPSGPQVIEVAGMAGDDTLIDTHGGLWSFKSLMAEARASSRKVDFSGFDGKITNIVFHGSRCDTDAHPLHDEDDDAA